VVKRAPGLYFVGLHFLYAMSSAMVHGVSRDADRIVGELMALRRRADARTRSLPARPLDAAADVA